MRPTLVFLRHEAGGRGGATSGFVFLKHKAAELFIERALAVLGAPPGGSFVARVAFVGLCGPERGRRDRVATRVPETQGRQAIVG